MKGIGSVEAVLILVILTGVTAAAIPYVTSNIQQTTELSEIQSIRGQFELCGEKLVETARTGSSNRCSFTSSKGYVSALEEGIYFTIESEVNICSQSEWVEVDPVKHIQTKCEASANHRKYQILWTWPKDVKILGDLSGAVYDKDDSKESDIVFSNPVNFRVLSLFVEFKSDVEQVGKFIDIKREELTADRVVLRITAV